MGPNELFLFLLLGALVVAAIAIEVRAKVLACRDRKRIGAAPRTSRSAYEWFAAGYQRGRSDGEHGYDNEQDAWEDAQR